MFKNSSEAVIGVENVVNNAAVNVTLPLVKVVVLTDENVGFFVTHAAELDVT